eukprot:Skav228352  [mRNA]  locus=scaffold5397:46762:46968:- [translate_table: standard]
MLQIVTAMQQKQKEKLMALEAPSESSDEQLALEGSVPQLATCGLKLQFSVLSISWLVECFDSKIMIHL